MAKIISEKELGSLVSSLLVNPSALGEEMAAENYSRFMTAIAQAVCASCGGKVAKPAEPAAGDMGAWFVTIEGNDSLPEGGGVWRPYDLGGSLNSPLSVAEMETAIAMDGYEIQLSEFKGYYFQRIDYASEDYPEREEAVRAAYEHLIRQPQMHHGYAAKACKAMN